MSETQNRSRLRQLALDYANGRISRSSYVRARTQFLDALTRHAQSGEETTVPRAPQAARPVAAEPAAQRPRRSNTLVLAGAAVGVAALLALAAVLLPISEDTGRPPSPQTAEAPAQPAAAVPVVAATAPAPPGPTAAPPHDAEPPAPTAEDLLGDPLNEAFWDQGRRDALVARWGELDEEDRDKIRRSDRFEDLTSELGDRIEVAFTIGQTAKSASLAAFGQALGIEVEDPATYMPAPTPDRQQPSEKVAPPQEIALAPTSPPPDPNGPITASTPTTPSTPTDRARSAASHEPGGGAPATAVVTDAAAAVPAPESAPAQAPQVSPDRPPPIPPEVVEAPPPSAQPAEVPEAPPTAPEEGSGTESHPQPAPEPLATPAPQETAATKSDESMPTAEPAAPDEATDRKADQEVPVAAGDDPCVPRNPKRRTLRCWDRLKGGGRGPTLTVLPGGRFIQGSGQAASERPAHPVTIARPFAISSYEISFEEHRRFCQSTGRRCPPNRWPDQQGAPAVDVSWEDAVAYTHWLSEQTGKTYRLPTESEWEYAARDGTGGAYPVEANFLDLYAHFSEREKQDRPVGRRAQDRSLKKNPSKGFGLYHMLGNAREWVLDAWHDDYQGAPRDGSARRSPDNGQRIVRGGSYADGAAALRPSAREKLPRSHSDARTGFRVVREIRAPSSSSSLIEMGNWWLAQQPDRHYSLQVFALERLDAIQRLLQSDPTLALKVVRIDRLRPPLRVLWGTYGSPQEAKGAAGSIPPMLAAGAGTPIPKRIAEFR